MLTIIGSQFNPTHNAFEIYVSGCKRRCPGCHNPEAQAFGKGKSARLWMNENRFKLKTGTFSRIWILGGDLMDQPHHEAYEFVRDLRRIMPKSMELWLWTGHGFDDVPLRILGEFDVVKAGAYREDMHGHNVAFGDEEDGCPHMLALASNNQQLHFIRKGEKHA